MATVLTHPDETPVPDPHPDNWPRARQPSPEFLALSEIQDRRDEMQKMCQRLTMPEAIRQPELKQMMTLLFDAYWDLDEKCELALKSAEYAKKESAMSRRHAEWALESLKQVISTVGQKNPSAPEEQSPATEANDEF